MAAHKKRGDAASIKEQLDLLCSGCTQVINRDELEGKLKEKKILSVKLGLDPTAPDLHLGHMVQLNKLKQFQSFGHKVIFLVGDFTARIGDPSGKSETRPPLDLEEIQKNAKTYTEQAYKVLDKENTEVRFNSEWSDQLKPQELIRLMSHYNVARMLEREDFAERYKGGDSIALHEFLYPLMQAYDSVALDADVELGGTDQTFNLMVARKIQRSYGKTSEIAMTLPLLEGLDGVKKMSKSLGNYIAFYDTPDDMLGKVMSISDTLMWRYFELLGMCDAEELAHMQRQVAAGENPRDIKLILAHRITSFLHDTKAAENAERRFINRFSNRELPEDIPQHDIPASDGDLALANAMQSSGMAASTSEAMRLIIAGAVRLGEDREKVTDKKAVLQKGSKYLVQAGKRKIAWLNIL